MTDDARETAAGTSPGNPPAADPPPAGPPPADDSAFAVRYGLVRPIEGRHLAGVCAAIGRATNTDPVFWRVLLAVLGFLGGIGVLIYLAAWLLIPAEGDSASPVEALLGRGRSSMSPVTTLLLGILVAILLGFVLTDQFRVVLLAAAIIAGSILLVNRSSPTHPTVAPPSRTASGPPQQTGGYRAPFAPHGPYPAPPPGHPQAAPGPYPPRFPPPVPPQPTPAARPHHRSPLGAATVSMIFVAIGVVAMLDLAAVIDVRVSAYFVVALLVIAFGLLVGSWFGRARWLIALGLAVSFGLGVATVVESHAYHPAVESRGYRPGPIVWQPTGYDDLAAHYKSSFGQATLDLTQVDFTDREAHVTVEVTAGHVTVIVPPDVDVTAQTEVNLGSAQLFGTPWNGLGNTTRVTDVGPDGPGGGNLRLALKIHAGYLEVRR
ncbi:MAG TPA: PspC domain-containing protein [Micromonosporaceae bacterium]